MSLLNYKFTRICGTVYRSGNLAFTNNDLLITPVGNRVTVIDLKKYESNTLMVEARNDIRVVEVSPDEKLLLVVDSKGQCTTASLITKMPINYFNFNQIVRCVKFSPNGNLLAACVGRKVQIYESPKLKKEFLSFHKWKDITGFHNDATCLNWSYDSNLIVTGSKDMTVRVFSTSRTSRFTIVLYGHKSPIVNIFFHSPNLNIYSLSKDGTLLIHNCSNQSYKGSGKGDIEWSLTNKFHFNVPDATVSTCELNSKTNLLVVGFSNGVFSLYEMPEFNLIQQINISHCKISTLALNKDGEWLAFGSKTLGQLLVWEWKSETYIMKQQNHFCDLSVVTYSSDGRYLVTGGHDGKVRVWNTYSGFCFITFNDHTGPVTDVIFSSNGQFVVSSSLDGTLRAYDLNRYRNFRTFVTHDVTQFSCLSLDTSSELLCAASSTNFNIYVWSVATGRPFDILSNHESIVSNLAFLPNSTELVSSSWDKRVILWNVCENPAKRNSITLDHDVVSIAVRSYGSLVAISTLNAEITLWDPRDDKIHGIINGRLDLGLSRKSTDKVVAETSLKTKYFSTLDISLDGLLLIAGGNSKYVCIYHLETLCLARRFQISRNLSLDGTQERLNSRLVKDSTVMDLLPSADSGSDEEETTLIKLPGVKNIDLSSRKMKHEIVCKCVKFSPTGRSFTIVSTEGLLFYTLDSINLFDPLQIDATVTIEGIYELLQSGNKLKALINSLKINDSKIVMKVMENFTTKEVDVVVPTLSIPVVARILHHSAEFIDGISEKIECHLKWIHQLLTNHGVALKHTFDADPGKYKSLCNMLKKSLIKHQKTVLDLATNNKYMLSFLVNLTRPNGEGC